MPALALRGLRKCFGAIRAVENIDLDFPEGKLICLLGPSGCGKTTLLRLIAGLETPDTGSVLLDGTAITATPAHRRGFGMVFQSLALFPHLDVGENIAYSLRIRGADKQTQQHRVAELLDLVQLSGIANRPIAQLSGGQRQRVAIARALALNPSLFLLDEPLSALDAKLREAMQMELRLLQQRLGVTTIVVTHDQREALTIADQVVVMKEGAIQQIGSPLDIYRHPVNTFVADFIGTNNLLKATVSGPDEIQVNGCTIKISNRFDQSIGNPITLSIRPEDVNLVPATRSGPNYLNGTITFIRDVGAQIETYIDCAGFTLVSSAMPKERALLKLGDRVAVELPANACIVLTT